MSGEQLRDGYHDVAAGKLATVVTFLEMLDRPQREQLEDDGAFALERVAAPQAAWYRDLFRRVGTDYLWTSRLALDDAALLAILTDRHVELFALRDGGRDEGILELDFRVPGECEIAFFGVTRALIGRGAGPWLMHRAIAIAWDHPIDRFWLHTCSLDHPSALHFYERFGFVPYARQVEIFDDPRVLGLLAPDSAPNVPLLESNVTSHATAHKGLA